MNRRTTIALLGALVLMGAAPLAARAAVEPLVDRAASLLGALARSIPKREHQPSIPFEPTAQPRPAVSNEEPGKPEPPSVKTRSPRAKPTPPQPSGGIFVRRSVVRAAVQRGIRPSASPIAASQDRPAGLVVHGWGAAGAGLADGDIITRVGGRTPSSVDDVVIAVAGAYKTKSHVLSGQLWRNGRVLAVTVELPLPKRDREPAGTPPPAASGHRAASRSTGGP